MDLTQQTYHSHTILSLKLSCVKSAAWLIEPVKI